MPPGHEVPNHVHADDDEIFHIIEGELTFSRPHGEHRTAAGACIALPRGTEILREATRLVEAGEIVPRIDPQDFTLRTISDTYRKLAAGEARGKLVVEITTSPDNKPAPAVAPAAPLRL